MTGPTSFVLLYPVGNFCCFLGREGGGEGGETDGQVHVCNIYCLCNRAFNSSSPIIKKNRFKHETMYTDVYMNLQHNRLIGGPRTQPWPEKMYCTAMCIYTCTYKTQGT